MNEEVLCIIPARGGSKGIPRKNINPLLGKPLIYYSIDAALKSKLVSRVIVSTEDAEIAQIAKELGAEVPFLRPKELAKDNIHSVYPIIDVINKLEKNENYSPDAVMMMLPTCPLTLPFHTDEALMLYFKYKSGSVISVCPFEKPVSAIRKIVENKIKPIFKVDNFNVQRQDYQFYVTNASIYIIKPEDLLKSETFHVDEVYPYVMSKVESVDINDDLDIKIVEIIMRERVNKEKIQILKDIRDIDLIVYDFDGVMTNNTALVYQDGKEAVIVNRGDGLGISMIKKTGIPQMIISTESNPVVSARAAKLGLKVIQGIEDKKNALVNYCNEQGYDLNKVIFVGNDMNDYDAMTIVGFPVAPFDAYKNVKKISKLVLKTRGGEGVVRELADYIIKEK